MSTHNHQLGLPVTYDTDRVKNDNFGRTLVVRFVDYSDAGQYECINDPYNGNFTILHRVNLVVEGKLNIYWLSMNLTQDSVLEYTIVAIKNIKYIDYFNSCISCIYSNNYYLHKLISRKLRNSFFHYVM